MNTGDTTTINLPAATRAPVAAVGPTMMRTTNQRVILDLLYARGASTRPQLARLAGLSQPTILAALAGLVADGLVREAGRPEAGIGRPAQLYEADPAAGCALGIDVGRRWIRLALCDLAGTQLARADVANPATTSSDLVDAIAGASSALLAEAGIDGPPTHTAIAAPGVFEKSRRAVKYADNVPEWQRPGLADALREHVGSAITIENDANLAAVAEHVQGAGVGASHLAYLHVGSGIGLGIVVDGEIYHGASGAAGEIAYLPIGVDPDDAVAPARGLLEERAAADSVARYAVAAGMPADVSSADVFAAARAGDGRALVAVRTEAHQLASVVAAISAFLDPELILVGGGVGQNLDLLQPALEERVAALTPLRTPLAAATLGEESILRGALVTGLRAARESAYTGRTGRS
ncbi:ROK family transcriptional regulator [Sediminihabitans luteus]|uniref:ROK family transcriptional regulator n=1 Tax=Sediminihabitans luteus TaxID=1138585 RepID=UPI0012FD4EB1|nr:ROK family transcriptional regulator [Sediminihabitans luteus]